jgi:hypothetical protein
MQRRNRRAGVEDRWRRAPRSFGHRHSREQMEASAAMYVDQQAKVYDLARMLNAVALAPEKRGKSDDSEAEQADDPEA